MTQAAIDIIVDPEFRQLIPPLTPNERVQLEANLLADGCRDALVVWAGENILLDGHNRLDICQAHGIEFDVYELEMADRDEAMLWISENQLGRRNMKPGQLVAVASNAEEYRSRIAKRLRAVKGGLTGGIGRPKNSLLDASANKLSDEPKTGTRVAVAKEYGVSERELKEMRTIKKKSKKLATEILEGKKTIAQAKREIKTEERKKIIEQKSNEPKQEIGIPELILADPPWRYDFAETENRKIENQYETAGIDEIVRHFPQTADDCVLFLWATAPKLVEAIRLIELLGFKYKTNAVWDKQKIGMGYWFRGQHELLLVATKGNVHPPMEDQRCSSVFSEPRKQHSEKPECVYKWIESTFPHLRKLEMYARTSRPGWIQHGNEI